MSRAGAWSGGSSHLAELGWFYFVPYNYRRQFSSPPFAARFYNPSYELKIGDLSGPTVMRLTKQRDIEQDKYSLEKLMDITDHQEHWVIPALTLVTMFERSHIKKMTDM